MTFSGWENVTPVSDQKITFFKKIWAWRKSSKCWKQDGDEIFEYGYHRWYVVLENPLDYLQTTVCTTLIKILEKSSNKEHIVEKILAFNS